MTLVYRSTMLMMTLAFTIPSADAAEPVKLKKFLPEPAHKAQIGRDLSQVRKKVPRAYPSQEASNESRKEYVQDFIGHPTVRAIEYYFDADLEGNPLYEVVYYFRDRNLPMSTAEALYGPPNHKEREWRFPVKGESWQVAVWAHEERLYVAAEMPGTEWEDGVD